MTGTLRVNIYIFPNQSSPKSKWKSENIEVLKSNINPTNNIINCQLVVLYLQQTTQNETRLQRIAHCLQHNVLP